MALNQVPGEFIAFAQELADAAGGAIRPHFRTAFDVIAKDDDSPVTIADRDAERVMRALIDARYPQHGVIGEEYGRLREEAEWVWILDPVDGTRSFVAGLPIFATLIGLRYQGRTAALGVIDQPITRERWWGARGAGAWFGNIPIHTRPCPQLKSAALFCTSTEFMCAPETQAVDKLRNDVGVVRLAGDAYGYAMVAGGHADIAMDATVQLYDYAALVPVLEEAGGIVTDWEGRALDMQNPARIIAAGDATIHAALSARLAKV